MMANWPLSALMAAGRSRGNTELSALRDMLHAFEGWRETYKRWSRAHHERAAKLELIRDKDAGYERRQASFMDEDIARCDVGIRALTWAIENLDRLPSESDRPIG